MAHRRPTHIYIGRASCGCVEALTSDYNNKETGRNVAEFIAEGLIIERITFDDYRNRVSQEETFMACPHVDQPLLGV